MHESITPLPPDGHSELCIFVPAAGGWHHSKLILRLESRSRLTTAKPDMRVPHARTSIMSRWLGYIPFYDDRPRRCEIRLIKETFENVQGDVTYRDQ